MMNDLWLQQLIIYWHKFELEWHGSVSPKLDENFKPVQPTFPEFMSWLVSQLATAQSITKGKEK